MSTFSPVKPSSRATAAGLNDTDISFSDALMDAALMAPTTVNNGHLAPAPELVQTTAADPSDIGTGPGGGIVPASETVTFAGSQLVFVNTYLSGVTDAYRTAVLYAEHELQSHFSNNVTITVSFGFANLGSNFLAQNFFHNQVQATYANLRSGLQAHATTPTISPLLVRSLLQIQATAAGFLSAAAWRGCWGFPVPPRALCPTSNSFWAAPSLGTSIRTTEARLTDTTRSEPSSMKFPKEVSAESGDLAIRTIHGVPWTCSDIRPWATGITPTAGIT